MLQLFIVLMAVFPFVLFGMVRRPNVTAAASIGLYLAARQFDWNLSAFPDGRWYLNPFCWQLLFVLGAWLALSGAKQMRTLRTLQEFPILRAAAWLYLLFALAVTVAGKFPQPGIVPDLLREVFVLNDRENLAPQRVLHILALAFLFAYMVPRDWSGFQWQTLQPVIKCGQEWLAVFCAGVFLSFAGHLVLITGPDSLAMHVLVSFAGILIMTGVAYYVSWSKRQDHKPAFPAGNDGADLRKAVRRIIRAGRSDGRRDGRMRTPRTIRSRSPERRRRRLIQPLCTTSAGRTAMNHLHVHRS